MMGETQRAYITNDVESSPQDKEISFEHFGKKDVGDSFDSRLLDSSEPCLHEGAENGSGFTSARDKEPQHQREAVIRPQQAGKIDFRSLHNRPSFPSDSPWGAVKGSPQSPTGKSRARDKNKRSGKGERGHQQLYRLTISNARPNPTIGIAYPQQKVTPPKKVELSRGPVSGSYRFHVPRIPEREVELQQEDLSFTRCFPEAASSHISSNYTSPAAAACSNHGTKMQPPVVIPHESSGSSGQLHYLEFQGSGNNLWHSPDKSLPGTNSGLSAPTACPFPDTSKSKARCLGASSFQYPFQPLHSPAAEAFQGDPSTQDYVDISLATSPASHGALAFHSSSKDWKEEALGNGPYESVAPESRLYGLAPPLAPFLPSPTQGHLPCYKGRNEHSADHNGAISPSGAIDQNPSTLQENQAVFPPSLHVSSMPKPIGKRQPSSKDSVASQRILDAGSLLRRSTPQISLPQVHFQNKAYGDPLASGLGNPGSVPFEKSLPSAAQTHPRLLQAWEASKRPYSPADQSTTPYATPAGNQLCFGGHLGPEQRQHVKKTWHHLHLPSAVHGQNRIELSRKLAGQKLPFLSEWEANSKAHRGAAGYSGKVLLTGEGAVMQRHNPAPQNCSAVNAFCLDGAKDADVPVTCGSRSKPLFFSVSQAAPPGSSRLPSGSALVLPPLTLAASPSESPLPSPAPNPTSGSSCSSLSPLSSSPSSHGFEDGMPLTTSPFFHHPCHPKDGTKPVHISEPLCTGSAHYHAADPIKAFHLSQGASRDDLLYKGIPVEGGFHKPHVEVSQGCPEGFVAEAPPPPYSSHHLLASSLSSASLDQLDVFLTCKQCDQNFSYLSSFLEHRQFCRTHVAPQGQAKDSARGTEVRKQPSLPLDSGKHTPPGPLLLPNPHLQLLALNKTVDFLADGEGKGEPREDPLKGNQLSSLVNPLALSTSDLEIDDAKLDSLITEALNGLGYQSDNPEIDSSFIDVFADEELASVKVATSGAPYKAKDGKKTKHVGTEENVKVGSYDDNPCGDLTKNRASGKQQGPKERGPARCPDHAGEPFEKQNRTDWVRSKAVDPAMDDRVQTEANTQLKVGRKSCYGSFLPAKQATKTFPGRKQPKNTKCASSLVSDLRPVGEPAAAVGNTKISAKEAKKRKLRSGTWSKELIQKIVQQKNKLHKLHTKSTKTASLSLLADRLLPETKDSKFGEYEYMSESDDERVEYAKRHCRRKLGSRFSGKVRSGFGRRHQGRGGREKDKEPAWSYGQRRAREEPQRASGKEAGRKDGCVARLRSRSCRSSTSSYRSTPFPSETSSSPQSTERADSDTEKEGDPRKSPPLNPERARSLPRELLNVPAREAHGRSRTVTSDWPGEPDGVHSARILPPVFKVHRNNNPSISPVSSTNEEAGLLRPQESLHPCRTAPGKSPAMLFGSEEPQEYNGRARHKEEEPSAPDKAPEACELGTDQRWPQITAYNGQYHVEELVGPSPTDNSGIPTDEDAAYEKVDMKHLEKQQPFISPISCFSDNPVGLEMAEKGLDLLVSTADTFYDCKELPGSYEPSSLFPGSPAIEPPHSDNVYLCQGDLRVGSFKRKPPEILPYEADQSKLSPPLSFDSSSVFGEIPVANFDATLYDSVSPCKDSYAAFPAASHPLGKIIPFDQQYSSFLPEKDWNQLVDVLPVLSEDLAPFHSLPVEKPFAKRFPSDISQMPVPLPERMADYNEPFMNSISDDDLEIKRLVTELESQLQTSKLNAEASNEHQTPEHHTDPEQKSANQFPPLTLEQPSDGKALFLVEDGFENTGLLSTKDCLCENSANEKTLLPGLDPKYGSHRDLWPCLVQFSPLQSPPSTADLILAGPLSSKEPHEKLHEELEDAEITGEGGFGETRKGSSRIIPVPENIEVPSYTDHLIQSPDSLFPKTLEAAVLNIHEALPLEPGGFPELPQKGKTVDGASELKCYGRQVPCSKPELGLQDARTQEDDRALPSSSHHVEVPEESLLNKSRLPEMPGSRDEDGSVLLEKAKEAEGATACQDPTLCDKTGPGKALLCNALPFSKEVEGGAEYASAPQGKSANPLQQLQLFVAQTVKNNEEDLLLPCFPGLHPASLLPTSASEKEGGIVGSANGAGSPSVGGRKRTEGDELGSKASDSAELHLEAMEQAGHSGEAAPPATEPPGLPCLTDDRSAEADTDRCANGLSAEHSHLCLLSNSAVTSLLREKGAQGAAVTAGQKKTTLAFRSHRKSPLSPGSFEQDTPSHALPAALKIQVTRCATWGEAGPKEQALCNVKTPSIELSGDRSQRGLSAAPTSPPENHYRDGYLLHKSGFCPGTSPGLTEDLKKQARQGVDGSQDGFPVESDFADQKYVQENNKTDVALSDFGELAPQELHCLTRVPEGRPILLCARRSSSSSEEKGAIGSPSECKKLKEATPVSPTSQPCNPLPALLAVRTGNRQRRLTGGASGALAESPKDDSAQPASPLFLREQTDPLAEKEGLLKVQTTSSQSPDEPSFTHKDFSEGELSNTLLGVAKASRSPSVSLQGIFLGASPTDTYSTQRRGEGAEQGLRGAAEAESSKVRAVESQHEAFSKDVDIQETLEADFTEADSAAAAQHSASHCPETGRGCPSQNTVDRQNETKEGCEEDEQPESFPSSREQEKQSKHGKFEDDSKTGQLGEERPQVACDNCSVSSGFRAGLVRARVAKGQENKHRAPALGPSKPAMKRNRKTLVKERGHSSCIPKKGSGQVVPRSYRRQRKAPSAEMQEVVSRVLSDLSVTHEPESTDCSSEDTKTTSTLLAESVPNTRKKSETEGIAREARPVGLGCLAEKKLRKKGRKGKGKGVPNQQKDIGSSHAESEIAGTVNLTLTEISKDMENGHSSTEAHAEGRSPVPPHDLSVGGFEVAERRTSAKESAGEETFQEIQSGQSGKGMGDPEVEEKRHPQDGRQPEPPKQVEKLLSHLCEEQSNSVKVEGPEAKDSSLDGANCTNHDSLLMLTPSPKSQQQLLDSGPDKKSSAKETSGKTTEGSSGPEDSKPWGAGALAQSNEGPDLQTLFDDDTTFSQLFPRNDQFARRKCTRVYGKRTKKLRPVAETSTRPEVSRELFTIRMASDLGETSSFCVTREDPCEYETISIDDALMLNMCHNSKTMPSNPSPGSSKSAASQPANRLREEAVDLKEEDPLSFLCQASPTEALPTLNNWDALGKEMEAGPMLSSPAELSGGHSVIDASPEPPDLEKEPHDARRNENPILPEFHTIDMEMLSTKFEAKDVSSNPAEENRLPPVDECALGLKQTPTGQGKPTRNKLEEGKQGKARSDLKAKEKQYKCKVCFQWFLTLGELDFHKLTHNPSPPPTCYMCVQRKFSSREQLRDHLKEKHAKNKAGLWACGMCLKEISDVWMYNEHLREHATQFARKGQAQKSVLGMPGCFSEDDVAVTHFLNSILCRKPSKTSKNAEPGSKALIGKDSKVPKEPQGQEGKASKDLSEGLARPKLPAASPKAPAISSPAVPSPKVEGPPKMAPMHPECKDPSRDCHHCGKQFPKPFKLQRHLVVHSLQKIFLCHKCPMFYQETRELRSHLSQEHGTAEEADIKHTTLYACELCADVMHVIKKSFICSTCNYTFSKKEQYDRHMEKHLAGGSKTSRFQGVMRPGALAKEGGKKIKEELRPREGTPAAKKKKVLHHSSSPVQGSPVHVDSLRPPSLGGEALPPVSEPLPAVARVTKTPPPQAPVKAEEPMGDFPDFLAEIDESPLSSLPSPPPLAHQQAFDCPEVRHMAGLPTGQLMKRSLPDENPPLFFDSPDAVSIDLASLAHKRADGQEPSPLHLSEKHKPAETPERAAFSSEAERVLGAWGDSQLQEEPTGSAEWRGSGKGQWASNLDLNGAVPQESACKLNSPEVAFHTLPLKDKASPPALNRPAKKITGGQADSENGTNSQNPLGSPGETQKPLCLKDKIPPETGACSKDSRAQVSVKDGGALQISPASDCLPNDIGSTPARHNPSEPNTFQERPVVNGLSKAHPRKRREHKASHKGSSASRENIEGDGGGSKRKKVRWPEAMRGEGAGGFTRADRSSSEALALSPRRRDAHCNKLAPKAKVSGRGGQLKKMVLDQCFQKKAEARHSNGDLKRKKDVLGKTYHPLSSKDHAPSLASSLNRARAVQGAKVPEAHHYRTAESQNNLLNQLFGQKLTSFKIPLRRDTSE